jgi:hypothetical protein
MKRTIAGAAVLVAILLVTVVRAEQHVLDLTVPRGEHVGGGEGFATSWSGRKAPELPLELRLVLDRASYFLGSFVVYDVTVRNAGLGSVTLPWTAQRVNDPASKLEAIVSLFTTDAGGRQHGLTGSALFGDARAPGTTLILQSGETARIRNAGVLNVPESNAGRVAAVNGIEREIRARIMVSAVNCEWSAPILSQPVSVTIRRNP